MKCIISGNKFHTNVVHVSFLVIFQVILNSQKVVGFEQQDNADTNFENVQTVFDSEFNEFFPKEKIHEFFESFVGGSNDMFEEDQQNERNNNDFDEKKLHSPKVNLVKPSYPYSPNSMKKLVAIEAGIYTEINKYIKKMNARISVMKKYKKDYEESLLKGPGLTLQKQQHAALANPFIFHRMMRRFSINFVDVMRTFGDYDDEEFLSTISNLNNDLIYPSVDEDYTQSLNSLLRIQTYNNYDTYEFSNGKLGHLQSNVSLRSIHAAELGIQAGINGQDATSIEWFEVALKKIIDKGEKVDPKFRKRIQEKLEEAVKEHDKKYAGWEPGQLSDFLYVEKIGSNFGPHLPKRLHTSDIKKRQSKLLRNLTEYGFQTKINFQSLCSGESLQSEYEKSQLYCWYETKKNPYLAINPFKMELLNKFPPLIQIYDVLFEKAIEKIIRTATPVLQRSKVINYTDPNVSDISDARTSAQAWLDEGRNPFFENIMKKIEFLTGLTVRKPTASETIQVASYGTSHHYDEHLDALLDKRRTEQKGDRIATFMIYLSNVEVGGKTAFPVIGTAANPVAGSAVFWHNLKRNGIPDKRTWHGGCPVAHGIKWVANKWILMYDNWDKRKCSLNPEE